jgi:hypothetical protein
MSSLHKYVWLLLATRPEIAHTMGQTSCSLALARCKAVYCKHVSKVPRSSVGEKLQCLIPLRANQENK